MQIAAYKAFILLSALITLGTIGLVIVKWPQRRSMTISQHAAANKKVHLLYSLLQTVGFILFYLFMVKWFVPEFSFNLLFRWVITATVVLELVTVWVPDTQGTQSLIHRACAYTAGVLLPLIVAFTLASSAVSTGARVIAGLVLAIVAIFLVMQLAIKNAQEKIVWYQAASYVLFYIAIIVATYLP
jgi:protein-S-isoprenylcysteine O-methyltransferase Ste14